MTSTPSDIFLKTIASDIDDIIIITKRRIDNHYDKSYEYTFKGQKNRELKRLEKSLSGQTSVYQTKKREWFERCDEKHA